MPTRKYTINVTVNGMVHEVEVLGRRLLSDLLRNDLHLTGTKRGCETGICGACSVLLDGEVVKSCLSLAVQAHGRTITTIEGLATNGELHPIQQAFVDFGGLQCGYCTPGMIMTACGLLKHNPSPTREEVRQGLNGNLCRCTGYVQIVDAIMAAAGKMK
jgi:aerobic carbon-monoxide dehydrogenase small subunit